MARQEQDREDLLAEAKALVERASLRIDRDAEETIVGFRRDGSASLFFGAARVYQFTSQGHLRRAFVDDVLYKAEGGRLVALRRHRTANAVELVRHDLDDDAAQGFLEEMRRHLDRLRDALTAGRFSLVGQVPETSDVVVRVRQWLDRFGGAISIARSPRVR
jgi:hypothetical protein